MTAPASTSQALAMLTSAMSYLAAAPATQMPAEVQAQALTTLERLDAIQTAARAAILAAFTASQGYCDDGDYSPRSWPGMPAGPAGPAPTPGSWPRWPPRTSRSPTPR